MINVSVKHEIKIFNKDGSVVLRHHDGDLGLFYGYVDYKSVGRIVKKDGEYFASLYTADASYVDVKSTFVGSPEKPWLSKESVFYKEIQLIISWFKSLGI
jgi:hypothetical protein